MSMISRSTLRFCGLCLSALGLSPVTACAKSTLHRNPAVTTDSAIKSVPADGIGGGGSPAIALGPNDRLITILGTNDIHGGIEASTDRNGVPIGGMDFWSGVATSIRQGIKARYGADRSGVLVVDAGDQFQGTLISNFNEGMLMFAAMSEMATRDAAGNVVEAGYDAVITGNHDYDFGPIGWLDDQVTAATADKNPRGALLRAVSSANFPMISANTFLRASIADSSGQPIAVSDTHCKPTGAAQIDWSRAKQPAFLQPYVIKQVAGLRVALVGLDNPETPIVTTEANVTDFCFDDEISSYMRVRNQLSGQADVFVIVMHDGNTDTSFQVSQFVRGLPAGAVDAVVSGHTHFVTNTRVGGIPIIQSGSGGQKFGRIDLVYDTAAHRVDPSRTRSYGGVDLLRDRCAPAAKDFCAAAPGATGSAGGTVSYEGVPVVPNARITALVAKARADVAPLAGRKLGTASGVIKVDRTRESPLANAMTDALRDLARTDIAFMNTGGIRAPINAGGVASYDVTYEDLFKVIPFNNHGLVIGPMGADKVLALLSRSITTCGSFGALMQSGLRVRFERDCTHPTNELDPNARLLSVTTIGGETIYDVGQGGMVAPAGRTFSVATLDFLAAGGSGFDGFKGTPVTSDIGIVREAMTTFYLSNPVTLSPSTDGRWAEQLPANPAPLE